MEPISYKQETEWSKNGKELYLVGAPGELCLVSRREYSGLENCMDRGAWRAVVHRVAKSRTQLSN